jgi:hypothetical protein
MKKEMSGGVLMKLHLIAALAIAPFLCSCTNMTIAGGGNDFPNSRELGLTIADNLASGDHWSDSVSLPEPSSPLALAQAISIPTAASQGLSKTCKTASKTTIKIDLSDTANGIVNMYISSSNDSILRNDTLAVLYDEAYRDTINNNERLHFAKGTISFRRSSITQTYSYSDGDGDGVINNQNGKPNRLKIATSQTTLLGVTTTSECIVDGGKDGNLDTKADIRILAYSTSAVDKKGDTLSLTDYESYDNDSTIIDASGPDSCLVRLRSLETTLPGKRTISEAVFAIYPHSSEKNHPVYYQSVSTLGNLLTINDVVRSQKSDSLVNAGDTALVLRIVESPLDSMAIDSLCLRMTAERTLSDSSGNYLIGFSHHRIKRKGPERDVVFSVTCNEPIKTSDKPQSGSFSIAMTYNDGQWVTLKGSFTQEKITAVGENSIGNKATFTWKRNGEPVE